MGGADLGIWMDVDAAGLGRLQRLVSRPAPARAARLAADATVDSYRLLYGLAWI